MSTQPNPSTSADPCAPFEDANGNIDILVEIETAIGLVSCIINEAEKLPGIFGHLAQFSGNQALHFLNFCKQHTRIALTDLHSDKS